MLDFLKNIKIGDPDSMKKVGKGGGGGSRKQWNPTGGNIIRVWKDGQVYPSKELVDFFGLEYRAKTAPNQGNGLDVFRSVQFPIFQSPQPLILLNVVDREKGKIDLFGTVGYQPEDYKPVGDDTAKPGDPLTSVLDQGARTFGADDLLPMIKEVYDVEPGDKGYIDLVVIGADGEEALQKFDLPDGKTICHVPKQVSRGARKGEMTYARREYPRLYALYPYDLLHPAEETEQKEA